MRAALACSVALVACGNHHAAKKDSGGTGDGSGAACMVDTQCTAGKCCSGVCTVTDDCSFAVLGVAPAEGFLNGGT